MLMGAYGSLEEGIKGTLEVDMGVVFDIDFFASEPKAGIDAQCDLTVLGGELAYDRQSEA